MNTTNDGRPISAWAVASARDFHGLTQVKMAERMTEATGKKWSEVMIRNLESGKRKASYADIDAVSDITGVPIAWFRADPTDSGVSTLRYTMDDETSGQTVCAEDSSLAMAA